MKLFIYCSLILGLTFNLSANKLVNGPNDTLNIKKAVVVYGNNINIDSTTYSIADLDFILDSLVNIQPFNEAEYNHYKTLKLSYLKSEEELVNMIEEFFSHDEVPFETINELNRYIAINKNTENNVESGYNPLYYNEPFPSAGLYGEHWDTERPVTNYKELWANLSVNEIPLVEPDFDCNFVMPHEGKLTSNFGWRYGRPHNGIDISINMRDPIKSAFDGVVRYSGYYGGFGRVVVVRHYNGLETLYAHLHKNEVEAGDEVLAGDIIGLGGSTGRSTGPHLHFEARFLGQPINPRYFIDVEKNNLKLEALNLDEWQSYQKSQKPDKVVHKVKKGDTLSKIAKRYGTNVNSLCKANKIKSTTVLRLGQNIVVYAPTK